MGSIAKTNGHELALRGCILILAKEAAINFDTVAGISNPTRSSTFAKISVLRFCPHLGLPEGLFSNQKSQIV
jgi:hypothetical protein